MKQNNYIVLISVIIPTYNGAAKLPKILAALRGQSFHNFETILVVDGSTDDSLAIIQKENHGFQDLKIIAQANGGRAVSRNRGVVQAKGDYLIFFDDDMRPTEEVIQQHLQHHQQFSDSILVGAQLEEYAVLKSDLQRYKGFLSRKWTNQWIEKLDKDKKLPNNTPYLTAAHFSISKDLFLQLGSFDERLTDAEDFDLAVRAVKEHIPIYFRPEILAWHDDFITCKSYIKRQRQYTEAHKTLLKLKPELYQEFNQFQAQAPSGIKRFIFSFFARKFWVNTIDKYNYLKFLPTSLKYRIYDWVISGFGIHFPERKL